MSFQSIAAAGSRGCVAISKSIAVKEAPRRVGDPPVLVANAGKIRKELGWEPKFTELRAVVETAWGWHSRHPNGYGS